MNSSSHQNKKIPVPALYHMHNYSSHSNWLAYKVAINQVRLIEFNESMGINQTFVFSFTPEPIKQIKLTFDQKQNQVYLAILFLTKYVIYKKDIQICSNRLKLDRNIVSFQNTFVSCDAKNQSKQIYFIFLTSSGEIDIVPVDRIQNKSSVNIKTETRLCSIKILQDNVALGSQNGQILLVDLNKSLILKTFDTNSFMPILHLGYLNKRIIASTCQGLLFNLSQDLSSFTSVSSHQGLVNHLEINDQKICTFGDDCILNVFEIDSISKELKVKKSQKYAKRANLIFSICNSMFLNFYEEVKFQQISLK